MLTDDTILARYGRHTVLAEHVTVVFRDDTTLQLHQVHVGLYPERDLRALRISPSGWALLDVRTLARTLDQDLRGLHERDVPGMVALTLRSVFPSEADCRRRAMANLMAAWEVHPQPTTPTPPRALAVRNRAPRAITA